MNEEKEKKGLFFKAPDRWKNLIIIGGLIGIALIFLSSYFPSGSGGSGSAEETLDKISALLHSVGKVISAMIAIVMCCMVILIISTVLLLLIGGGHT